jgi:hypothetical protein
MIARLPGKEAMGTTRAAKSLGNDAIAPPPIVFRPGKERERRRNRRRMTGEERDLAREDRLLPGVEREEGNADRLPPGGPDPVVPKQVRSAPGARGGVSETSWCRDVLTL